MKTRNRLCSMVVALFLLPFICAAASANTTQGIETQITTNNSNQMYPDIYGERIVWQDDRNGYYDPYVYDPNWDIYMYDLSASTETQITTNESNQSEPAIYEDRIVWTDDRNENSDAYTVDVYMYNLSTSTETRIADDEGFLEYGPDIFGDKIVYMSEGAGDLVWVYDLSTAERTFIAYDAWSPAIYGDRIVWAFGMVFPDIYMYDLSSSSEIQITSDEAVNQMVPAIYGDRIVWEDWRNENGDIYMFTLTSAELTPLEKMKALTEYVENTYKCHMKTKTGFTDLLDTSKGYYENGDDAKAISMLNSFIHLAEKMKVCKQISADEADYMVREAKEIIDQIQAQQG
jgi:TolB protein